MDFFGDESSRRLDEARGKELPSRDVLEELLIRVAQGEHMPYYQNHYSYLFCNEQLMVIGGVVGTVTEKE